MVDKSFKSLLFRGTRHGFASSAFHSRCDGKANTITIIENDNNHVYGGLTSAAWPSSDLSWSADSSAYLFSLRRDKSTNSEKYLINESKYAIYGASSYGPIFGAGNDIEICSDANINKCNQNYKRSYNYSSNYYLAGKTDSDGLVTEIKVYQLE
jgi:hypothetical protein